MTRGKHGAAAAQKRAESASDRAAALEAELRQERAARREEVAALKAQVQQLQGRLVTDVKRLASERVDAANTQAQERLQAVEDSWHQRMRAVVRAGLTAGDPLWEDPQNVADVSGLAPLEVVGLDPLARGLSRGIRRQFVTKGNRNRAQNALAETAAQGDWQSQQESRLQILPSD